MFGTASLSTKLIRIGASLLVVALASISLTLWVTWQLESEGGQPEPFSLLRDVLERLSHPDEPMRPAKPARLYLDDVRKFPTIELPYGTIPVVHASAGMKRILGLAYLITWMWTEHVQAAQMIGRKPADRLVLLVDEPETHLHPRWQRHVVPALLDVVGRLGTGVRPQMLVTTHAPTPAPTIAPAAESSKVAIHLVPSGKAKRAAIRRSHGAESELSITPWPV